MPVITTEDLEDLATSVGDAPWDYVVALPTLLAKAERSIASFREALVDGDNRLIERFQHDEPVEQLVRDRARLVDTLLRAAWKMHLQEHAREIALVAVGGYGRGELNLCSDIDIMVLLPKSESARWQPDLERFL